MRRMRRSIFGRARGKRWRRGARTGWVRVVQSHPFRKERGMDGALGICGSPDPVSMRFVVSQIQKSGPFDFALGQALGHPSVYRSAGQRVSTASRI
jgi:hypothetical protein